jgi:tRNA(Ile)-lysidine synthase TilS/MesJ
MNDEYFIWKEEQGATLDSLKGKDVSILFSGGKDSSLCLYFLHAASEEFGFGFEVHIAALPKHRYRLSEVNHINTFWKERGVEIFWHDIEMSDDVLQAADNPCSPCRKARRQLLNEAVRGKSNDLNNLVLVTAYTLSDLVSYILEYLAVGVFATSDGKRATQGRKRLLELGQRIYPVLKINGAYTIYRPVLRYNAKDITRVIQEESIPIFSIACRYARFRPKKILESYYQSIGLCFDYDRVIEFVTESLGLPSMNEYLSMDKELFLKEVF